MKKKKYGILFLPAVLLLAAVGICLWTVSDHGRKKTTGEQEAAEQKLTIWLDAENEYDVRYRAAFYLDAREKLQGTEYASYFTDMDFELVSKSGLSGQQYREEMELALEKGEGPDIIYMDACNGVDPTELIKEKKLAPLGGEITKRVGETLEYAQGALEAGQQDGTNYVLPICMECPIVFGIKEDLEAAGIHTDRKYGSLDEFLDALLAAQDHTGKLIFESPQAADWLEQYYLPQDADQKLSEKLARVRGLCGTDESTFSAYHGLAQRECLLGGCGIYDYKNLGINASVFGEQQLALFAIPDSEGAVSGRITHAAAVNADSENVQEALKALLMFQYAMPCPDITVINEKASGILETADSTLLSTPGVLAVPDKGLSQETAEDFKKCSVLGCSSMSYVQQYGDRDAHTVHAGSADKGSRQMSICYADMGDAQAYPLGRLLNQAAASYAQSQETVDVQLLSKSVHRLGLPKEYRLMDQYQTAPDALICPAAESLDLCGIKAGMGADFDRMLKESSDTLRFLPDFLKEGIRYGAAAVGLPIQVREYGAWVSRRMLKQAGLSEDWKPKDAVQLTKGMEKLAKTAGPANVVFGRNEMKAYALFAEPDSLLVQQEDGSFRCSKDSWANSIAMFQSWKDAGIARRVAGARVQEAMQKLAEGKTGMVLGCSDLSGYIDGAYGAAMTKKQQQDLVFLSLSPAAEADILFVSQNSDHAEEAFAFWKEALCLPNYEEMIRANCGIPVTQASENVRQILPLEEMKGDFMELLEGIWESDDDAQDLAERYPLYEWTET